MALINCPECKREVSNTVKKCIHCGSTLKRINIKKHAIYKTAKLLLIIAIIGFTMFQLISINNSLKNLVKISDKLSSIDDSLYNIGYTADSIETTVSDIYTYLPE